MQTTLEAAFELAELSAEQLREWNMILDRFASQGSIPLNAFGRRPLRDWSARGFVRLNPLTFKVELTATGAAAE